MSEVHQAALDGRVSFLSIFMIQANCGNISFMKANGMCHVAVARSVWSRHCQRRVSSRLNCLQTKAIRNCG